MTVGESQDQDEEGDETTVEVPEDESDKPFGDEVSDGTAPSGVVVGDGVSDGSGESDDLQPEEGAPEEAEDEDAGDGVAPSAPNALLGTPNTILTTESDEAAAPTEGDEAENETEEAEPEETEATVTETEAEVQTLAAPVEEKVADAQVYRLYNPYSGEHLYTLSKDENDFLSSIGWKSEGVAWIAPGKAEITVYRLYNRFNGEHLYTTNKSEYDSLGKIGWTGEGIAWYGEDSGGTPLYRFFNPYATVGTHHFTSDMLERMRMVADGWVYEGIAWFGVDTGPVAPANAAPNTWVENGGARFYIQDNGTPVTGWQTIGGKKYYFDGKGRMATGVKDVAGTIYSFNSDGTVVNGWQALSGYWCYFNSDGSLKHDGWFTEGGNTYYLDKTSGAMATGNRWIDGVLRPFASNGVCLKTGYQTCWGNLMLAARNVTLPGYANGSYWSYVHPCTISANATREQVIEAFIAAAYDYQRAGTRWVDNQCGAPGTTVDCSGLVMESLYAVGMDLTGVAGGDFNPYSKYYWNHHFANTWRLNNTFQPISFSQLERGDIVYYSGHVAIYLGNGQILESTPYASNVREASVYSPGTILGCARPFTK